MHRKKTAKDQKFEIGRFFRCIRGKNTFQDVYYLILDNTFLFIGVVFMASSILNFDHGRYCDGTIVDHYSCVNSATFYEYSTTAIFVFIFGVICTSFWYVKRNTTIIRE